MFGNTKLLFIETKEKLEECVEIWKNEPRIGVDLEGDSLYSYREKICLIQISDSKQDYIIDPLKISDLSPLFEVLESPDILKIMHGADFDIVSLKRDYNVQVQNLFDTLVAAQFLGYPKFGLSALIFEHFGISLEKKFQTYNWSARPLYEEPVDYARGDTHFLLSLYEILHRKIQRKALGEIIAEECLCITQKEWNGRQNDGADFLRIKKVRSLKKEEQLRILRSLYYWREELGKEANLPVFKIFLNEVLKPP